MGKKAEAGTPKAIANAMKSKGLQRLRWYCQVCEKQCRDENAFKQHSLSEGHVRQMLVVGEHASSYINTYSEEFKRDFIALLSRRWGTKRVRANQVYQEFIQNKTHTHMNSTRWVTLTAFCQYLGRAGIAHVDETEKGWFLAWIDNSPKALAKQDAALKKERQDINDEQRQRKLLAEQMERMQEMQDQQGGTEAGPSGSGEEQAKELPQEVDLASLQPIKFSFRGKEKETSPAQEGDPNRLPDGADAGTDNEAAKASEAAVAADVPRVDGEAAVAETSTPIAEPKPMLAAAIQPAKPKANPFKLANKSNLLKANPLKTEKSGTPASETSSSSVSGSKRPLSAMESIIAEEQERKRKRENSTWSGSKGHGREGLQRR